MNTPQAELMSNRLSLDAAWSDPVSPTTEPEPRLLKVSFAAPVAGLENSHREDCERILSAAVAILVQGEELLNTLSTADYTRRVPAVFNACIGGHYRHCLDHFASLLRGAGVELVDYDHRERDPRVESRPDFALFVTRDLRERLNALTVTALAAPVHARCEVSYEHGDSPITDSSLARELAYCIAHAIHHFALISVMAHLLNVKLPENFGVAPSTVAHLAALKSIS